MQTFAKSVIATIQDATELARRKYMLGTQRWRYMCDALRIDLESSTALVQPFVTEDITALVEVGVHISVPLAALAIGLSAF